MDTDFETRFNRRQRSELRSAGNWNCSFTTNGHEFTRKAETSVLTTDDLMTRILWPQKNAKDAKSFDHGL